MNSYIIDSATKSISTMKAYIINAETQSIIQESYSDISELTPLVSSDSEELLLIPDFCGDNNLLLYGCGFYPKYETSDCEYLGIIKKDDSSEFPFVGCILVVGKLDSGNFLDVDAGLREVFSRFTFIEKSEAHKWLDENYYTEI